MYELSIDVIIDDGHYVFGEHQENTNNFGENVHRILKEQEREASDYELMVLTDESQAFFRKMDMLSFQKHS